MKEWRDVLAGLEAQLQVQEIPRGVEHPRDEGEASRDVRQEVETIDGEVAQRAPLCGTSPQPEATTR